MSWENSYQQKIERDFNKRYLNEFLSILDRDSSILDIGCGNGRWSHFIACEGHKVTGVDFSKKAILLAKQLETKAKFKLMDITKGLKFKEESFDAIFSLATYHALNKKGRQKYVEEVKRILKKGGALYQLVLSSEDNTLNKEKEVEPGSFLQKSGVFFHLFTKKELLEDFKAFKVLKIKHLQRKLAGKTNAIFIMIMKKM